MLRKELYALDGTDKQQHPYTVTEQNFTVERLQPRASNQHGVFFAHACEAVSYHHERNPADPRVSHAVTLEVDPFGNVLKSAAIGYGRSADAQDAQLLPDDRDKQQLIHITCTENEFTTAIVDDADAYRTPLPAEARTYELRRAQQEKTAIGRVQFLRFEEVLSRVKQAGDGAHDIEYEDTDFVKAIQAVVNDPGEAVKTFRRLIKQVRTLYRPNDLGASQNAPLRLLPLRTTEWMALAGETYKLAFTKPLLDRVYARGGQELLPLNPSDVLEGGGPDHGGYAKLDGKWWIPSGRVFYSPGTNDNAATELAEAKAHFFLPRRYRDPFHKNDGTWNTETTVDYDTYDLLVRETRDALGNRVTVDANHYCVLEP